MVCLQRPFSALLILFTFLLSTTAYSAQMIKAGSTNFPPFYVVNEDLSSSGIYLDIMEQTLQHANLDYRLDIYPTKRLYRNLAKGETDLFIGIKGSPAYDNNVLYSNTAVSKIQLRIYALEGTPLPQIKEDLNGHKVITIRGYGYGGLVSHLNDSKNNIGVTSTTHHRSSFLMLKNKRADYLINYKHPSETALASLEIPGLKYTSFYTADIYFIVSKHTPNAKKVLEKLEHAYLDLVAKGELEYIENENY